MFEENNNRKKGKRYLVIGIIFLSLAILGTSVAYYLARVQSTLNGRAAGTELEISVTKLSTNATGDLIPLDNDLETLGQAALGYQDRGACVDINGYSVCQIYKITLTNNGSVPLTMNGTVTLSGQNVPNIDCATMTNPTTVANNNSCMGENVFVSGDTLAANSSNDYYVMVYIKNLDEPQYDSGEFNGVVTFTTEDGDEVKGRFTRPFNLVQRIETLYNDDTKTEVENNSIKYNYATGVGLMKDRLGGTSGVQDSGNIRYYGAEPDNYIDIGDRTSNDEVILWRIIGVFDGKLRVIRDESIGNYSWDTSASNVNGGYGINEWSQADLMKLLNPGYETNQDLNNSNETITVNNSLYWNSGSGKCYKGLSNATIECDFRSIGLSDEAKEYVVDQTINLGGINYNTERESYANQYYSLERGSTVIPNPSDGISRTLSWTGKVGLIYPSDYGYATDFTKCTNTLYNYDSVECKTNDWLFTKHSYWTMSLNLSRSWYGVVDVRSDGSVLGNAESYNNGVHPVLTLASEALAESGNGSKETPYVVAY